MAEILPRAAEHGDRRSVRLLKKLSYRRGCDPNGRGDCYACLRPLDKSKTEVNVRHAVFAASRRPAPVLY